MRNLKKIAALVLAMSMVFSSAGLTTLAADETTAAENEVTTESEAVNEESDTTEQNPVQESEVTGESETVSQDEEAQNTETQNTETQEEAQTSEISETEATEKQKAFEYVYVDEQTINIPEEQNIAIVFADTELVLESATLHGSVVETGAVFDIPSASIADNAVLFTQEYSDAVQAGQYQVDSITYRIAGQTEDINVNFAEQEVTAGYTVTTEPEAEETVESEESEAPEVTVYSMDDAGNTVEQSGETENIESAVESVLETADEQGVAEAAAATEASPKAKARTAKAATNKVIVICAGHDATHTGATGNGLREEQLTWKVANYCKQELEKYSGVTVYLDRSSVNCAYQGQSTSYCLNQRVKDAAVKGASVFVDIHFNSAAAGATGAEVYYPNNSYSTAISQDGKNLANQILQKLTALGLYNRGAKILNCTDGSTDDNGVLEDYYTSINMSKYYGMTGVIVEHAFLTNASDAAKLKDENFLKQLGVADAQGIANTYGLKIGGNTGTAPSTDQGVTVIRAKDYSAVYNYQYYINRYSDIKAAFGNDPIGAIEHFIASGMREGRQASEEFNVSVYKDKYADLRNAFNNDLPAYYLHYINQGKDEGRTAGTKTDGGSGEDEKPSKGTAIYQGRDYSAVYDFDYYISKHADVKKVYGTNDEAVLEHFVINGMKEGRQAKESFDVNSYRNRYSDLRIAFGSNLKAYYDHYIDSGQREGRTATGVTEIHNPVTTYNGRDYSAVYDFKYYINKYSDIKKLYQYDDLGALKHFVEFGMKEGRQASSKFDVKSYKNAFSDLRIVFRSNFKAYYDHYIDSGKREGRIATGVSELRNPVTKYNGKDYSAVYDFNYYINRYSDMKKLFQYDDIGALEHFVLSGIGEGRQASEKFNVDIYKTNYSDLSTAFGNNKALYYQHYMEFGKSEGRIANDKIASYHTIMGTTSTTVDQMVRYFNKKASYPSKELGKGGAEDIRTFCQIYIEEAAAEGVRAEVAFAQAMKETGFLKYGGIVKIEQFNFAGLGALDGNTQGQCASFKDVRTGIRAQIQHLKAYANKEALNQACVDPRFHLVKRGTAPYVEWLGIKENPNGAGWATAKGYGESVVKDYMEPLLAS